MSLSLHELIQGIIDEGSREVFCKLLTSAGYAVQSAYDGLDAIRHMEKTQFNVAKASTSSWRNVSYSQMIEP